MFLRNSLWWALARTGNSEAMTGYLEELSESTRLSALNRGYLLYYYGDLGQGEAPPFFDDDPNSPWVHTRTELYTKYSSELYGRLPPGRRVIDLYTFCDLAKFRSESLTDAEGKVAMRMLQDLGSAGVPAAVMEILNQVALTVIPA